MKRHILCPLSINRDASDAIDQMKYWLPRLHVLVIGPGLGRDKHILDNIKVYSILLTVYTVIIKLYMFIQGFHFCTSELLC